MCRVPAGPLAERSLEQVALAAEPFQAQVLLSGEPSPMPAGTWVEQSLGQVALSAEPCRVSAGP